MTAVVTKKENPDPGEPQNSATRLVYAANQRAVNYVYGETWGNGQPDTVSYAREFRYDSARQRYLNREVVPGGDWEPLPGGEHIWSDYDGHEIYGDFTIDGQTVANKRSFELGIGKVDPWAASGASNTSYYHGNQIGTTRFMTNWNGDAIDAAVYTAFGELRPNSTNHRYGYAGSWGYQAHDDFPYLHVGYRYYDPSTGRFLQRDPIGIRGGLNVYAYARLTPTVRVDPDGLQDEQDEPNDPPAPPSADTGPEPTPPKPEPKPRPPEETPQEELRRIRRRLIWTAMGFGVAAAATFWCPPVAAAFGGSAALAGGSAALL